jgi:hypothetical protein
LYTVEGYKAKITGQEAKQNEFCGLGTREAGQGEGSVCEYTWPVLLSLPDALFDGRHMRPRYRTSLPVVAVSHQEMRRHDKRTHPRSIVRIGFVEH